MENPATNPSVDPKKGREQLEADPILLALPRRDSDDELDPGETWLEQLQIIETGSSLKNDASLLMEYLKRSSRQEQSLAEPDEEHSYHNPLASVIAYKHRLHAIRCEYVDLRLRLESELKQVKFELVQVRASRMWRLANEFDRWRKRFLQYLGWFRGRGDSPAEKMAA